MFIIKLHRQILPESDYSLGANQALLSNGRASFRFLGIIFNAPAKPKNEGE